MPEDNDGSYTVNNLQDGLKDTPWCEGASGTGEGSTLQYECGSRVDLSSIDIVNGNGTDLSCLWLMDPLKQPIYLLMMALRKQ